MDRQLARYPPYDVFGSSLDSEFSLNERTNSHPVPPANHARPVVRFWNLANPIEPAGAANPRGRSPSLGARHPGHWLAETAGQRARVGRSAARQRLDSRAPPGLVALPAHWPPPALAVNLFPPGLSFVSSVVGAGERTVLVTS